jgi:DNA-binding NarL/FixJ family response regulator
VSGENAIRVFLLDDHEVVRRGVRELLEAEHDIAVVGEADSAELALARLPAIRPDVALLDVRCLMATASRCAERFGRSATTSPVSCSPPSPRRKHSYKRFWQEPPATC